MSDLLKSLFEGTDASMLPLFGFLLVFALCLFGVMRVFKVEKAKLGQAAQPPLNDETDKS